MKKSNKFSVCKKFADKKTFENKMIINKQVIRFSTTFKVETKQIFDELLEIKRNSIKSFKASKLKSVKNAIGKFQREQSKGSLKGFNFSIYFENQKIIVGRN
jgi:hypothetical protein